MGKQSRGKLERDPILSEKKLVRYLDLWRDVSWRMRMDGETRDWVKRKVKEAVQHYGWGEQEGYRPEEWE